MTENRQIARDSLFLLADLVVAGGGGHGASAGPEWASGPGGSATVAPYRVKVRNLSAKGMMGEGVVPVHRGDSIRVSLRNLGWIEGSIAWVQGNRFGVAFARDVDAALVRTVPAPGEDPLPPFLRDAFPPPPPAEPLRKI